MLDVVVLLGCGAVGKTVLLYWNKVIPFVKYKKMIIIDPRDISLELPENVCHAKVAITRNNYSEVLDLICPNLIIDLSIGVASLPIINYCVDHNISYVNTAQEDWADFPEWDQKRDMYRHSLILRQRMILQNNGRHLNRPTIVLDHGINPGLISHFAKLGIEKMAQLENVSYSTHAEAAHKLSIKTIQVSEIDTQITNKLFDKNTFVNTWSALGFIEEATDPVQIGWGTHEPELTIPGTLHDEHQRFVPIRGMNMIMRGYEPTKGYYNGYCIPHGEAASLPQYLTHGDYRPSVYYVYSPSIIAQHSINNLRERNYISQQNYYILNKSDIESGYDSIGALLIRENGCNFWTGTILNVAEVLDGTNATCVQAACGVLAAIDHVYNNPDQGIIFPEKLDSHRVLQLIRPYLGIFYMDYVDAKLPTEFCKLITTIIDE